MWIKTHKIKQENKKFRTSMRISEKKKVDSSKSKTEEHTFLVSVVRFLPEEMTFWSSTITQLNRYKKKGGELIKKKYGNCYPQYILVSSITSSHAMQLDIKIKVSIVHI